MHNLASFNKQLSNSLSNKEEQHTNLHYQATIVSWFKIHYEHANTKQAPSLMFLEMCLETLDTGYV